MTTRDLAVEREEIDRTIDGKTVCHLLARNAEQYAASAAVSWKEGDGWRSLDWREYRDAVAEVTIGLRSLGVGRGDFVALMSRNRPEHLIADLGALHSGATPVSFYNTLAPEQVSYIAGHCEAKVAVLEGRDFMERWEKVKADLPALEHVVLIDDHEEFADLEWVVSWDELRRRGREVLEREGLDAFERSWQVVRPDDIATLVYTSGTTGPPKGVIITHRNVLWTAESLDRTGAYPPDLRAVSYLPLAHILERIATHYLAINKPAHVYFCPEIMQVIETVPVVRPQGFVAVPRLWEKLQAGIAAAMAAEPNERRRKIALRAVEVGRRAVRLEQAGKRVPLGLRLQRAVFERLVYSKIRTRLGLDQCRFAVTGAAPIAPEVLEFFCAIGLPIYEGWGMTESTGAGTLNREGMAKIGTVGPPIPGVEVRIASDGEVLMRGGSVCPGYYKDSEKTAETFGQDGWLHTGDIGRLDADGFLKIVDRKKELIITAGGKNISPANLETLLKVHPLIGQACAIGDRRPYVSALIVLDAEVVPGWANQNGLPFTSLAEFGAEQRVIDEIQRAVDDANQKVSNVEAVKRFVILPAEWTVDSEELTPTLKLKRRVIHEKYADEIEGLYR